ncbi:MAG TPA: patatin-like phospholipase family protein [Bacteroidota bacterium]|nr:patatin-like phospholipase family protein [Bacteroidota bacterium]
MAKKILQIDGGGLKGVIPAVILENFEKVLGKQCCEVFDLITGTSTGAIIGGVLASGVTDAHAIREMYVEHGKKLFTPRVPFAPMIGTLLFGSKYERTPFQKQLKDLTNEKTLGKLKTIFMATAFNLCSGRTHFIYSSDESEQHYPLWEVISWSALSAAAYFGKIDVPEFLWDNYQPDGTVVENMQGAVFQDGGQGINNCTLSEATTYAIAKKWFDEEVIILSLGCGDSRGPLPYSNASRTGLVGQVIDYFTQARGESTINQYLDARYLSIARKNNITLVRLDCALSSAQDMLDGVNHIAEYVTLGEAMMNKIPFDLFK